MTGKSDPGRVLHLYYGGLFDYHTVWSAMRHYAGSSAQVEGDELWVLSHPAVYTRGVRSSEEPRQNPDKIPVVQSDRGGMITYHGPDQVMAYPLIDIRVARLGVRNIVYGLEGAVIDFLSDYEIVGDRQPGAPGVYVDGAKIAALGLRIRNKISYHGLSFNVGLDLEPFSWIDPCGYEELAVTSLHQLGINLSLEEVAQKIPHFLAKNLGYASVEEGGALKNRLIELVQKS